MTTAAAALNSRDPFMPRRPAGMKSGLALALLAHALLIAGLAYSVDWHASDPAAVEAELWSAVPQQAAPPPSVAPPPPPPPPQAVQPPAPAPAPKPQPVQPPPPPQIDPQIAIEKVREAKRVQLQQELVEQEKARREKARRDQARQDEAARKAADQQARDDAARKKQLADKQQADKDRAEQVKAEQAKADKAEKAAAAQREAARQAQLNRMMKGLSGATGENTATGTALKSSGPSAGYAGRIVARIKPNIVFPDAVDGNPMASVEVRVAPDGSIVGKRLVQSSGVKSWDDAVLRAIDRTDGLPRDIDGRVPPVMTINFRPRDL